MIVKCFVIAGFYSQSGSDGNSKKEEPHDNAEAECASEPVLEPPFVKELRGDVVSTSFSNFLGFRFERGQF